MTDQAKPATILRSTSGSGNALHIVNNGGAELFLEAFAGKKRIGIHVTPELLARALRNVGLYVTTLAEAEKALDDLTHEQQTTVADLEAKLDAIESLAEAWKLDRTDPLADAGDAITRILHPEPPYEFPTREGAVIEAEWLDGDGYASYSRIYGDKERAVWVRHSNGVATTEYAIRRNAKNFRTIYEGIDE